MSARNTILIVPGHWTAEALLEVFWSASSVQHADFAGADHPRVSQGLREASPYTLLQLRLFEEIGFQLMNDPNLPDASTLEMQLGAGLSSLAGQAVFAFYDEERGAGGAAVFVAGALQHRCCFDARGLQPVRREGNQETPLRGLDPSDWIWVPASETIDAALTPLVGAGIRDDDDIAALISAAREVSPPVEPVSAPQPPPAAPGRRSRVRARIRRWFDG